LLKRLHGKAVRQLGSSGSGNHFVEFGIVEMTEETRLALLRADMRRRCLIRAQEVWGQTLHSIITKHCHEYV